MRQDDRAPFDAVLHRARVAAHAPGEFVGQESFMTAGEIRALALRAGIGPGVTVLDLCCGVAGPGRFLTRELGCAYLGVDASASAVAIARDRAAAAGLACRFEVGRVPPVPPGPVEVVVLLETLLAFRDKGPLLDGIAAALAPGGRFAFTLEEGRPLSEDEARRMPDADTVWLSPLEEVVDALGRVGLHVQWTEECSRPHQEVVDSMISAFTAHEAAIAAEVGRRAFDDLVDAHQLWSDWLASGRVRKFAVVAQRAG